MQELTAEQQLSSSSTTMASTSILVVLLAAFAAGASAATKNNCSYTVWPAVTPVGGGKQLGPGQTWTLDVPTGTQSGRIWGRTGCFFNGAGHGHCATGDCAGALSCTRSRSLSQQPHVTLAEFTIVGSGAGINRFGGGLSRRLSGAGTIGSSGGGSFGDGFGDTGDALTLSGRASATAGSLGGPGSGLGGSLGGGLGRGLSGILAGGANDDKYGISLVNGYNLPMDFSCSTGGLNLHCGGSSCPDAKKTHGCRGNSNYKVTFCQ